MLSCHLLWGGQTEVAMCLNGGGSMMRNPGLYTRRKSAIISSHSSHSKLMAGLTRSTSIGDGNLMDALCQVFIGRIVKKGQNPPNPGPTPPSPVAPPTVCDNYYSCESGTTCCCVYQFGSSCFAWGCCPLEATTCCEDHYSCCPHDYPLCNVRAGTCHTKKDNPVGVKALVPSPAKPHSAYSGVAA